MGWYDCHPMVDDRYLTLAVGLSLDSPGRCPLNPAALIHRASSSLPLSGRS